VTSLADVAQRAGVAPSTASRALNRPELVSSRVVERVRAAAAELGYSPNPFARSLRVQDSKTLGIIVPDSTNPFFAEVARGIEAACFDAGYTLILCNSDRSLEKEAAQARVLVEKRVDGVLWFVNSRHSASTVGAVAGRGVPVVVLERRLRVDGVDCVVSSNQRAMQEIVEHLVERGHRRIACLVGDLDAPHYAERLAGFRRAMQQLGLTVDTDLIETHLTSFAEAQTAAVELVALPDPPTAIVCTTDTLAIGTLRGVTLAGKRVPHDIAVTGFGDTEVTAYTEPPLTCVVQDKTTVGTEAFRLLLRRVSTRDSEPRWHRTVRVIRTRLVVRESTATLRTAAPMREFPSTARSRSRAHVPGARTARARRAN
jgi:DNA-binding LacI/PurR family transcriptional regulator